MYLAEVILEHEVAPIQSDRRGPPAKKLPEARRGAWIARFPGIRGSMAPGSQPSGPYNSEKINLLALQLFVTESLAI